MINNLSYHEIVPLLIPERDFNRFVPVEIETNTDTVTTILEAKDLSVQKDRELVSQCLSGSQEAWSQLCRRTYNNISFVVHWRKWNFTQEQAEEIIQDIFMSLIKSLKLFEFNCSLETFAANIAKKKCVSEIRRVCALKRAADKDSISIHETDVEGLARVTLEDRQSSFEDCIESNETKELLIFAMNTLGEKCRGIIELKYYDNRSYEEIVALLNVPLGTVASRLKRCLLELRSLYEKEGGEVL